jgi:hypothetical protein
MTWVKGHPRATEWLVRAGWLGVALVLFGTVFGLAYPTGGTPLTQCLWAFAAFSIWDCCQSLSRWTLRYLRLLPPGLVLPPLTRLDRWSRVIRNAAFWTMAASGTVIVIANIIVLAVGGAISPDTLASITVISVWLLNLILEGNLDLPRLRRVPHKV